MRKHMNWCFLLKDGEVHHKNGIRTDNRIKNLEFIPNSTKKKQHRLKEINVKLFNEIEKLKKENKELKCKLFILKNQNP